MEFNDAVKLMIYAASNQLKLQYILVEVLFLQKKYDHYFNFPHLFGYSMPNSL